jgi:hypothetical protein
MNIHVSYVIHPTVSWECCVLCAYAFLVSHKYTDRRIRNINSIKPGKEPAPVPLSDQASILLFWFDVTSRDCLTPYWIIVIVCRAPVSGCLTPKHDSQNCTEQYDSNILTTSGRSKRDHITTLTFRLWSRNCMYVFCVDLRTNSDYFTIQR